MTPADTGGSHCQLRRTCSSARSPRAIHRERRDSAPGVCQPPVLEGVLDNGVYVRGPAHRPGVAEQLGGVVDRCQPRRRRVLIPPNLVAEGGGHRRRGAPGAEVLGGERLAGHLTQIVVDIGGVDGTGTPVVRLVGEQTLPAGVATLPHQIGESAVTDGDVVVLSTLGDEAEGQPRPDHLDVSPLQGGEAVGAVGAGIPLVAHADQRGVQQANGQRGNPSLGQPAVRQVVGDGASQTGQPTPERLQAVELRLALQPDPLRVVHVLLASGVVPPRRLDVTVAPPADPHVGPRRGHRQGGDALLVRSGRTPRVAGDIAKSASGPHPAEAGLGVGHIAEFRVGKLHRRHDRNPVPRRHRGHTSVRRGAGGVVDTSDRLAA